MTKYLTFLGESGAGFVAWVSGDSHAEQLAKQGAKKARSAGFIRLSPEGKLECYGRSMSLDVDSRATDSELANRYLRTF